MRQCRNGGSDGDGAMTSYSLVNNENGEKVELPLVQGTLGPAGADVGKVYDKMDLFTYDPGFTSTCSCKSAITYIDGDKGILLYRGYPVDQLANNSSFVEVAYLILNGELPNKAQLEGFEASIRRHTMINESLRRFFDGFRYDAHPMAMLTGIVGSLSAFYHDTTNNKDARQRAGHPVHPACRPRAERLDLDRAPGRLHRHQPVRRHRQRHRRAVGSGPRRRQRGGAEDAGRDRQREERAGLPDQGQGQEQRRAPDGLRPPRLQELRPARDHHPRAMPQGAQAPGQGERPAARAGAGAGAHRAVRRLLQGAQALPERRLLLRHHLQGPRHPGE